MALELSVIEGVFVFIGEVHILFGGEVKLGEKI